GESVQVPESGEKPVRQSCLPAKGDRADPAGEAPAVHVKVHERGRATEGGGTQEGRRPEDRGARGTQSGDRRFAGARVEGAVAAAAGERGGGLRLLISNDD